MIDKDSLQLDRPRRTPDHPTKSHVVKTMVDGSEKIIRFGEQGAVTAGKPKEGESDAMKAKRASFKARHGANIAKGKSSPAYWADKVKWAKGGSVSLEELDQKYEGIKKPDFENLRALNSLIQTLQQSAEESRRSEFDPVAATRRSAPSTRSLADLFTSYEDAPMASHAGRVEAGVKPADALSLAASQMGLSETGQRAAIQDYLTTGGANLDPATTAWCAAFVNSTLQQTGGQGTGSNMARSFLDWGQPVDQPQEGDVAVFSRGDPSGPYGHVGFFKGYDDQGNVLVLGGNQGDAVSISPYPRENLLGFRRAGEAEPQKFAEGGSTGTKSKPAPKPKPTVAAAPNRAEAYRKSAGDRELDRLLQENLSKPLPASAYVDMPWSEYLPRVGRRLPSSTAEMLDDTANMVLHPIDTASAAIEGVGNLGYGIGSKALRALGYEGDRASEAPVDATLAALMGRYGLGERGEFWKNLAEDPASYVADVAGLVTGGAAAAPKVARLAEAARDIAPVMYADAIGTARALASGDLEFMRGRGLPQDAIGVGADVPRERNVSIPDLRAMNVDDAIAAARLEPHLIDAGNRSEGLYLGGPRTIQSREDLEAMRKYLDDYIAADPRGGDWYDRYRAGVNEVTGGDPRDNLWMTNLEGQYSAGVSPEGELGFALKDTNRMIATGDPGKPARPAQAAASLRAAMSNDPTGFQLGPKTGEYAKLVDPSRQGMLTATGVNDFRHLRNLGYTEASGEAQRNAVGAAGHRFADYETALAVGRANDASLAGRSNWTGEQLQAAPWVRQKALDFLERGRVPYNEKAKKMLTSLGQDVTESSIDAMAYELAFQDANRTIADFFPKHTAFATHEAQPYRYGDHLSGLADAPAEVKIAYAQDPRSTWAIAPGGRDAIYSGLRYGDTGYAMRVRPTTGMQGVYEAPGNVLEYNLGEVARPLVSFDSGDVKSVAEADQSLLNMGEALRGYVDYQGATPWHKVWEGGKTGLSNSVFATKKSAAPASPEDISKLKALGEKYGLPDVIDTGEGVTFTNFMDDNFKLDSKTAKKLFQEIDDFGKFKTASRVKVDSGYPGYEGTWEQGAGSGAATRQLFEYLDAAPAQALIALDQNPMIPKVALNRLARDKDYAAQYGVTREDLTNAREIIGSGPGWVGRLRKALAAGAILPGIGFALLSQPESENVQ